MSTKSKSVSGQDAIPYCVLKNPLVIVLATIMYSPSSASSTNVYKYTDYIDLKKAFDYVDRDMLLYKLLKLGIDGKMY